VKCLPKRKRVIPKRMKKKDKWDIKEKKVVSPNVLVGTTNLKLMGGVSPLSQKL